MIQLLVDAIVLVGMIKAMGDEDVGIGWAILLALVASIGIFAVTIGLIAVMPPLLAMLLAGVIGALGVGAAVSALYGLEIKRAMVVGVAFMLAHVGIGMATFMAMGG